MPKLKTHKGTAKRVKLTAKHKLLREHAFGTHFLSKKSASRKRAINSKTVIKGSIGKSLKRALGV